MTLHDGKPVLDDLSAFATVARHGSYTRAAAQLRTSTSNLSHTIRRLESKLGYRVLQRNSRSVALTEAGKILLSTLAPALQSIQTTLEALSDSNDRITGTLRLTSTRQAYDVIIRPILSAFTKAFPDATIEVLIDYAYRDIVAEQFDAGIRLGEKLEHDMIALKVGPELRMSVVAAPSYLAAMPPIERPSDLIEHRCVNYRMVSAGSLYAWEFERDGQAFDVQVQGPLTFNEPQLMLDAVLDGLGVGYLLEHEVADYVEGGRLMHLLAEWTPPFPGFHLYYPSRRQLRPVMAAFLDLLRRGRSSRA